MVPGPHLLIFELAFVTSIRPFAPKGASEPVVLTLALLVRKSLSFQQGTP